LLGAGRDLGEIVPVAGGLGLVMPGLLHGRGILDRARGEQGAGDRRSPDAWLVRPLGHRSALVLQRDRVAVLVDAAHRLVHLDELTMR